MDQAIGIILAISAGLVFYMPHYDMVPKAHKERECLTAFGAAIGFIVGFVIVMAMGSA
jgi:zinc transporter ZupT